MRSIVKCLLLVLVFVSCNDKKLVEKKEPLIKVKDIAVFEETVTNKNNVVCSELLIDIVQSNLKCKELIENIKEQNVKYGFQIDSTFVLSKVNLQDSVMVYDVTLIENHPTHIHNAAFFRFNPQLEKIYLLNMVEADYQETDGDKKLISNFKKYCRK